MNNIFKRIYRYGMNLTLFRTLILQGLTENYEQEEKS